MSSQELRRDPIVGRWVIFSPSRMHRPHDFLPNSSDSSDGDCEYCGNSSGREADAEASVSQDGASEWRRRVSLSPVPIVSPDEELSRRGEGMFDLVSSFGVHEIVLISRDHRRHLARLSQTEMADLVVICRDRLISLKADQRLRSIAIFGNHGTPSTTLITHEHLQVIATPIIPRILSDEIAQSYRYFQSKERCVYCDIQEDDLEKERVVFENDRFTVVAPYASRFAYEMWVMPRHHTSHFEDIGGPDIAAFSEALCRAFVALDNILGNPPYSFILHNAPTHEKGMAYYHWHLEIMPRLANIAGFEWGTGFHINPTFPEEAAKILRKSLETA